MKIAIVTDTNSGFLAQEAAELGVFLLPMPFSIDGQLYLEGINLSAQDFYRLQEQGASIMTSQPSPDAVTSLWDELLASHDAVIHIPMSSALSNSCSTAQALSAEYDGKVLVADLRRISITQKLAVIDAVKLVNQGLTAQQVVEKLEENALEASIYLVPSTLSYLKKGGRITPTAAAIGTVLNIKPVLQIQGGPVDSFKKVRGMRQAIDTMLQAIESDLNGRFAGKDAKICVAYSGAPEVGEEWRQQVQEYFPNQTVECNALSLSIACHTGPGALGIGCICSL